MDVGKPIVKLSSQRRTSYKLGGLILRIVALETSLRQGSLATLVATGGIVEVVGQTELPPEGRSAQTLLPALDELIKASSWRPHQIELVAVTSGPGSFTGLRIGVTAAKSLAFAVGAKLVAVHTLAALTAGVTEAPGRIWAILDAQRQELFVSCTERKSKVPSSLCPDTKIMAVEEWLTLLSPGDTVTGPPLAQLAMRLPAGVIAAAFELWQPQAVLVGRLGVATYETGGIVDPLQLVPNYFRKSAAEEKRKL